jgi:hypothetical protein
MHAGVGLLAALLAAAMGAHLMIENTQYIASIIVYL